MIGSLRGILRDKQPPSLLLEVNGVGYEVEAPMSTFYQLPDSGEEVFLYTHLVVREDAQLLYGFHTLDERRLFRALIRVNGVGPRLALAILSGISAAEFAACVQDNDTASLVRLPGIGKKTAERLIVEMRDRMEDWQAARLPAGETGEGGAAATAPAAGRGAAREAITALVALGYRPQEASRMVSGLDIEGMDSEDIIRAALRSSIQK